MVCLIIFYAGRSCPICFTTPVPIGTVLHKKRPRLQQCTPPPIASVAGGRVSSYSSSPYRSLKGWAGGGGTTRSGLGGYRTGISTSDASCYSTRVATL